MLHEVAGLLVDVQQMYKINQNDLDTERSRQRSVQKLHKLSGTLVDELLDFIVNKLELFRYGQCRPRSVQTLHEGAAPFIDELLDFIVNKLE